MRDVFVVLSSAGMLLSVTRHPSSGIASWPQCSSAQIVLIGKYLISRRSTLNSLRARKPASRYCHRVLNDMLPAHKRTGVVASRPVPAMWLLQRVYVVCAGAAALGQCVISSSS
jgi:hypothetical protein